MAKFVTWIFLVNNFNRNSKYKYLKTMQSQQFVGELGTFGIRPKCDLVWPLYRRWKTIRTRPS